MVPIKDFRRFCRELNVPIVREVAISTDHHDTKGRIITFLPNLFATFGIFLLGSTRIGSWPPGMRLGFSCFAEKA